MKIKNSDDENEDRATRKWDWEKIREKQSNLTILKVREIDSKK